MGYREKKEKAEKVAKKWKMLVGGVAFAAVVGLCVFSAFCPPQTWKYYVKKPKVDKIESGELRMHFIDVGQGDATLVELPDGKVLLVDGGDGREPTAKTILRYMNALDIDVVDYLVVTHADADHCGSLAEILSQKQVLNAYLPAIKPENAGAEYQAFYAKLLEEECAREYAVRGLSLGNEKYTLAFLYPFSSEISQTLSETDVDNNLLSSVLWLDYKGTSTLFTGDAPFETEYLLKRDDELGLFAPYGVQLADTEILKVAHHGSGASSSLSFLKYLQAETAVISCGKNNVYKHPSGDVLSNLMQVKANVYRTDENGSVVITVSETGDYAVEFIK